MATPKVWTANDVKQGRLYINPLDAENNLLVERDYRFTGASGAVMPEFGTQVISTTVPWASVPQNIKDALIAIDQWTYSQILAKEGMT